MTVTAAYLIPALVVAVPLAAWLHLTHPRRWHR